MPLHLPAFIVIFLLASWLLDKYAYKIFKSWGDAAFQFGALLMEQALLLLVFCVAEIIIGEEAGISIYYRWWRRIPDGLRANIIFIYWLYAIFLKWKHAKDVEQYSDISSIRRTALYPVAKLNHRLILANACLDIWQRKLSLLKSFSPIPVALLIFNNFSDIKFDKFDIKMFATSNQLNILLLLIIGLYTQQIITAFARVQRYVLHIAHIQEELHAYENPEWNETKGEVKTNHRR